MNGPKLARRCGLEVVIATTLALSMFYSDIIYTLFLYNYTCNHASINFFADNNKIPQNSIGMMIKTILVMMNLKVEKIVSRD